MDEKFNDSQVTNVLDNYLRDFKRGAKSTIAALKRHANPSVAGAFHRTAVQHALEVETVRERVGASGDETQVIPKNELPVRHQRNRSRRLAFKERVKAHVCRITKVR